MYNYQEEKKELFTEKGQVLFLAVRDRVQYLLKTSGAFRLGVGISDLRVTGSSWQLVACIDRLVELGEIVECPNPYTSVTQFKVYTNKDSL